MSRLSSQTPRFTPRTLTYFITKGFFPTTFDLTVAGLSRTCDRNQPITALQHHVSTAQQGIIIIIQHSNTAEPQGSH